MTCVDCRVARVGLGARGHDARVRLDGEVRERVAGSRALLRSFALPWSRESGDVPGIRTVGTGRL